MSKKGKLHLAQQEIYYGQMMDPQSPLYNTGGYTVLKGKLNVELFKRVVTELPQFFDVFSMRFDTSQEEPLFYLDKNLESIPIIEIDLSKEESPEKAGYQWLQQQFDVPFNLNNGVLCRFALLKISEHEYWWQMLFHHLIIDGFGFTVLVNHVTERYDQLFHGIDQKKSFPLYTDAIDDNIAYLLSEQYVADKKYWEEKYKTIPKSIVAKKNIQKEEFSGGERFSYSVSKEDRALFERLTAQTKASLSQFTVAALLLYFGKITGEQEISVGTPMHNRGSRDERKTLGMFAAVLAFKGCYLPEQTVFDCIKQIKRTQRNDFRHRNYPISSLNRSLKLLSEKRQHIFDVIVNYEPLGFNEKLDSGIDLELRHMTSTDGLQNPLSVRWCDYGKEYPLELKVDYMTRYFNKEEIERFVDRLFFILRQFEGNLEMPMCDISIVSEPEQKLLLSDFNGTNVVYNNNQTVVDMFCAQVAKTPDALALVFENKQISYKELDDRSNQLARHLLRFGVQKENLIPICVHRSPDLLIGILGILKAGGAYVPIDPKYPQERIEFILDDTKATLVITQTSLKEIVAGSKMVESSIYIDDVNFTELSSDPVDTLPNLDQLIYVIYTSGTTGIPKGVLCKHKGVANLVLTEINGMEISRNDIVLQFASVSFDAFGFEVYPSLVAGSKLVMVTDEIIHSKAAMSTVFIEEQITLAVLPPSYQQLLEDALGDLRILVSAGEPLLPAVAKKIQEKGVQVINAYGPTENSVCATWSNNPINSEGTVTIGKPLANTEAYILDEQLQLVPLGEVGELCLGGAQLAAGYLNREELTKEKFVVHPFKEGEVLYKTGDLASWSPDGTIEFVGRKDNQVKINGYRIELEEIESILDQNKFVQQSAVVVHEELNGRKKLVAYFVPALDSDPKLLQRILQKRLPDYMVPKIFVPMEEFPLTNNGKIDRKALAVNDFEVCGSGSYEAPSNENEELMVVIWQEFLGVEKIGVRDNFFDLGGDSIQAIQLVSLSKAKGLHYTVNDIFYYQNIAEILAHAKQEQETLKELGALSGVVPLHPIQLQFFEKQFKQVNHYNQSVLLTLSKKITKEDLGVIKTTLVEQHDTFRLKYLYKNEETFPEQCYGDLYADVVEEYVTSISEITDIGEKYQASLNILKGDVIRFVWIQTPEEIEENRLLIIVHHLAMDGVSWRILLEDFGTLVNAEYFQLPVSLAEKGSSFRQWTEELEKYASSSILKEQLNYWKNIMNFSKELPADLQPVKDVTYKETKQYKVVVESSLTNSLLKEIHAAYGTDINDILLSALAISLSNWIEEEQVLIALEGHGREQLFDNLDVNKTIGWFTSLYPVVLPLNSQNLGMGAIIASVKDTLREVPNKGLGYGVLRYLSPDEEIRTALSTPFENIVFNYLGNFDNQLSNEPNQLFGLASENSGEIIGLENTNPNKIAINSLVLHDCLEIQWSYSDEYYHDNTIEKLAEAYTEALRSIVEHCKNIEKPIKTRSDYYLPPEVSYQELQQFQIDAVHKYPIADIYPLSPLQEGLMFHSLYQEESSAYVVQFQCDIVGELSISSFRRSWRELLGKHSILRTAFFTGYLNVPVQCVYETVEVPVVEVDFSHFSEEVQLNKFQELVREEKEFIGNTLEQSPLFRISLVRLTPNKVRMVFTNHHILWDGWSFATLLSSFLENYEAIEKEQALPEMPQDNYGDHVRCLLQKNKATSLLYWKEYISGVKTPTEIPFLKIPSKRNKIIGNNEQQITLPLQLSQEISSFTEKHRITINTFVQGAWGYLLSKYTGQEQVVFGATVSGRDPKIEDIAGRVGLYINTIPVCLKVTENSEVVTWLRDLQEVHTLGREEHGVMSLSEILAESEVEGELFDSLVVFENYPTQELASHEILGFTIENFKVSEHTNFAVSLSFFSTSEGLSFKIMYSSQLIGDEEVNMVLGHLQQLLKSMITVGKCLKDVSYLTSKEEIQLTKLFNNTTIELPAKQSVIELFTEQAQKTPEAIAVVFGEEFLTYDELDECSNRLARYLIQDQQIKSGSIIGVCMDRSLDLIVAVLGILKTRSAYVSLDPSYPENRLQTIIRESRLATILTSFETNADSLIVQSEVALIRINQIIVNTQIDSAPLQQEYSEDDAVYILFTSGSTGVPKGVTMCNNALVNLLQWQESQFDLSSKRKVLQFASINFDVSFQEMASALCFGQELIMVSEEERKDMSLLLQRIEEHEVTHIFVPFVVLESLALCANELNQYPASLKEIITAGEQLRIHSEIRSFIKKTNCQLINQYGPSETHVVSSYRIADIETAPVFPSIGTPIFNTEILILDTFRSLVPVGVVGELCVSGVALAEGYLNRPDLTNERFVVHPFKEGERLYTTGDLAKWLPDGTIEFVGRKDDQVKIRGFRIELGEIEMVLDRLEEVQQAVVLARENEKMHKELVAYFVPAKEEVDVREVQNKLKKHLPEYMVPKAFIILDEIPVTANGKINKKGLPAPSSEFYQTQEYIEPSTSTEVALAIIWKEVLRFDSIGVNDNFFEIGGNSLLVIQLVSKIKNVLGYKVKVQEVFQFPTITGLASLIENTGESILDAGLVKISQTDNEERIFCAPGAGGNIVSFYALANLLEDEFTLYGFQAYGLDGKTKSYESIQEIARQNIRDMQVVDPEGPYRLAGYSMGANVVHEMTLQLRERGYQVAEIISFDGLPYASLLKGRLVSSLGKSYTKNLMEIFQMMVEAFMGTSEKLSIREEELRLKTEMEQLDVVYNQLSVSGFEAMGKMEFKSFVHLFLKQREIWERYVPENEVKYYVPVTLFRTEEGIQDVREDYEWENVTKNEIMVYRLPANHMNLLNLPFVVEVANKMKENKYKQSVLELMNS